jgi:hypothetical protein
LTGEARRSALAVLAVVGLLGIAAAFVARSRVPILLEPLPPSGLLRTAEISSDDPAAHENRCLRRMLGLRRPVLRRATDAS